MPTIRFNFTVLAGGQEGNAVAGNQFEFIGAPSQVQLFIAQDSGVGVGNVEMFFGQEIELPQSVIPERGAGLGPVVPDDEVVNDLAAPGDRLVVRLTETGGALSAVIRGMVKISPVPLRM